MTKKKISRADLRKLIRRKAPRGRLPCAGAFRIAAQTGVSLKALGRLADEMEIRISRCQLGCF